MKRQTKTYPSAQLASYPFLEFVADKECQDIQIMLPNEKFLDLLIMLDMAYGMADGAKDEHTKHEISTMVIRLVRQYKEAQGYLDLFEWSSKCYEINRMGEE